MIRHRSLRALAPLLAVATVLGACGGSDSSDATPTDPVVTSGPTESTGAEVTQPAVTEPAMTEPAITEPAATEPAATEPAVTEPAVTEPTSTVPADPWSATADTNLAAIADSFRSGAGTADVFDRLFAAPVDVPLPDDAAISTALVVATATDTGWDVSWTLRAATLTTPAELEAAVTAGFSDERFEPGVRVVSTLDSGEFVTLNNPATDAGIAEGWETLAIVVGPETDFDGATGRNEIEISVTRAVTDDEAAMRDVLGPFLTTWILEMPPLPDGLELTEVRGDFVDLSDVPGVWLDATWRAEPAAFEDLVTYYAQDLSSGALVLEAATLPDDLSVLDRFVAGFFPTLAGHDVWLTVERDLSLPDDPVQVGYEVRLEAAA